MRGFALLGALCLVLACDARDPRPEKAPGSLRIVSINPSLTAILVALGARDSLVGIDEVSATARLGLRDWIHSFCAAYPQVPVIVTSRIVGYDDAPVDSSFVQLRLEPFDDEQLGEFIERWYAIA